MAKQEVTFTEHNAATGKILDGAGLLLGSYDAAGKPNIMTIGWGCLGRVWSMPMAIVLVRPSRYTYQCIEHSWCFTVNVPTKSMGKVCAVCGVKSGRDMDKFAECGVTAEKASTVEAPVVVECPLVYECRVVHANDVIPEKVAEEVVGDYYAGGDFHRVYFGKILSVRAEANAAELLGG